MKHTDTSHLLILVGGYTAFFVATWWARRTGGLRFVGDDGFARSGSVLIALHVIGIVVFLLPAFVPIAEVSILTHTSTWAVATAVVTALLAATIAYTQAKKTSLTLQGKAIPIKPPTTTFTASYFVLRICFIIVYEWWFRGVLLLYLAGEYGLTTSLNVNIILYSAIHIVNGKREAISCIPFGLMLCGLCLWNDAVWPAMVVHLALTLTYEIEVLRKVRAT